MYALVAVREGQTVESVPGFVTKREAKAEARRLNSLPRHWHQPDGQVYHRPEWQIMRECETSTNLGRR